MERATPPTFVTLPERGEPHPARCQVCGHQHACYVSDRPGLIGPDGPTWLPFFACLGCLMRAADPVARESCADCVFPA